MTALVSKEKFRIWDIAYATSLKDLSKVNIFRCISYLKENVHLKCNMLIKIPYIFLEHFKFFHKVILQHISFLNKDMKSKCLCKKIKF